jgi:hypothetical protein
MENQTDTKTLIVQIYKTDNQEFIYVAIILIVIQCTIWPFFKPPEFAQPLRTLDNVNSQKFVYDTNLWQNN